MSEDRPTKNDLAEQPTSDSRTGGAGKRRLFVRLGIVAIVIVLFVIVPGYISSRPQFLQRYEGLQGSYGTWATSVHAQVACQNCHVSPTLTAQTAYRARMLGEFYLSLVLPSRQPRVFAKPTNEACQSCHLDLRTVSPSGDLNIPHRAHVLVLKLKCIECHSYLVHAVNPEGTHTPRMAMCLTCHDGQKAKNECSACHTNKRIPANHRAADWVVVHAQKQGEVDCKKCHKWTANWCSECHARRPKSHTKTWRTDHGAQVKVHRNCEACHGAVFCVKCHGEVPNANFDPALKLAQ